MKMPTFTKEQWINAGMHKSWVKYFDNGRPISVLKMYRKHDADIALAALGVCESKDAIKLARRLACRYIEFAVDLCLGDHVPNIIKETLEIAKEIPNWKFEALHLKHYEAFRNLSCCIDVFRHITKDPSSPPWNMMFYYLLEATKNIINPFPDFKAFLIDIAVDCRLAVRERHGEELFKQTKAWQENVLREMLEELT